MTTKIGNRTQAFIRGYEAREAGRPSKDVENEQLALQAAWLEGWNEKDDEIR